MLRIDGVEFDVKCEIKRVAEISASYISGLLLDKSYFNDVLGTYLEYEIRLTYPLYNQGEYASLYEMLTMPVDAHAFVLPYNTGTISLTARVETISDDLLVFENGKKYWRNCTFSIISNGPSKEQTLESAIQRGLTPLPDVASPNIGDTYTFTSNGWVAVNN